MYNPQNFTPRCFWSDVVFIWKLALRKQLRPLNPVNQLHSEQPFVARQRIVLGRHFRLGNDVFQARHENRAANFRVLARHAWLDVVHVVYQPVHRSHPCVKGDRQWRNNVPLNHIWSAIISKLLSKLYYWEIIIKFRLKVYTSLNFFEINGIYFLEVVCI